VIRHQSLSAHCHELGPVVHPQVLRRPVVGDEALDHLHHLISGAVPPDAHGEGFSRVFVDDVEQLQPAAIRGLIKLEVERQIWLG
jgi:hypothetical protein